MFTMLMRAPRLHLHTMLWAKTPTWTSPRRKKMAVVLRSIGERDACLELSSWSSVEKEAGAVKALRWMMEMEWWCGDQQSSHAKEKGDSAQFYNGS
jgi:hypothetical protein